MLVYPSKSAADRDYLSKWFTKGKHLVITDTWVNENSIDSVAEFIKEVDHVIFDFSHNPWNFDNFVLPQLPVPHTILANDHRFFYQSSPNVCWFPVFFYIWNQKNPLWYQTIDFELKTTVKNIDISCLNATPSLHRMIFYHQIKNLVLTNKILFSFGRIQYAKKSPSWNLLQQEERQWIEKNHPIATEYESRYRYDVGISHEAYQHTALNIVTETTMNIGFLSEKICKPLASDQFFLVLAKDCTIKFLSNVGFDTFNDVIDHRRYDGIKDMRDRIQAIAEYVNEIADKKCTDLYATYRDRLEKNRKWLFGQEFENIITHQIAHISQNWR